MKRLKFRAWDTLSEIMVEPYLFEPMIDSDKINYPGAEHRYYGGWLDLEDGIWRPCIIMQFIDHEDCEGVDMFTGDILSSNGFLYVITWNDRICAYQAKSVSNGSNWSMNSVNIIYSLIIGNIHQNPELLTPHPNEQ
jgi:hypothetical protein